MFTKTDIAILKQAKYGAIQNSDQLSGTSKFCEIWWGKGMRKKVNVEKQIFYDEMGKKIMHLDELGHYQK